MIGRRPRCVWEWGVRDRTIEFLHGVDPAYFEHVARINEPALRDESKKHYAALSIRTTYSHAVETFLAMLFAAIQAPDAMYAWLLEYEVGDLRWLIEQLNSEVEFPSRYRPARTTWEDVAKLIHPWKIKDDKFDAVAKDGFARMWRFFAHDFLDEAATDEYNSIKHGLRARSGGFLMAWGSEQKPGEAPPRSTWSPYYGSEFGSTYYAKERFDDFNFRGRRNTRNWNPNSLIKALQLVSISIHNVVAFARYQLGDREDLSCRYPDAEREFVEPWLANGVVITSGNWDGRLRLDPTNLPTDREIMRSYNGKPVRRRRRRSGRPIAGTRPDC